MNASRVLVVSKGLIIQGAVAALYCAVAKFSLGFAFEHQNISPVWPPTGLALALLLRFGYRFAFGIGAGAFLGNVLITETPTIAGLGIGIGNALEALTGCYLIRQATGSSFPFTRTPDAARFILLGVLLSTTVSATMGVASLCAANSAAWNEFWDLWWIWWTGDAVGCLLITPFLLSWFAATKFSVSAHRVAELSLLAVVTIGVPIFVFCRAGSENIENYPQAALVIPVLIWGIFRFGLRGFATVNLVITGFAIWGTVRGHGPFVRDPIHDSLMVLQGNIGVVGMALLLTATLVEERWNSESELRREQFLMDALVENIPDPVFFKDLDGRFVRVNRAMAHDAGYDHPSELVGKTDADIWAGDLPKQTFGDEQRIIETGESIINKEEMPMREGGPERWVLVTKLPLRDESQNIVGTLGVAREITDRKKADISLAQTADALRQAKDALERSNQELQQFASIASHDLQSPLRSVSGFVQLLQKAYKGKLDDKADNWVACTVEAVQRMHVLIHDLMEYSRSDSLAPAFVETDVSRVFDSVVAALDGSIHDTRAELTRDDLPSVLGNHSQLFQLLQNLIDNGLKYHGDEPPRMHVSAENQGSEWVFSVRDNGIGIEPRHHEKIFEFSSRLHTHQPGTGIGLALCRKVVHRHRGRIWVESQLGHGSTFYFTIPVRHECD